MELLFSDRRRHDVILSLLAWSQWKRENPNGRRGTKVRIEVTIHHFGPIYCRPVEIIAIVQCMYADYVVGVVGRVSVWFGRSVVIWLVCSGHWTDSTRSGRVHSLPWGWRRALPKWLWGRTCYYYCYCQKAVHNTVIFIWRYRPLRTTYNGPLARNMLRLVWKPIERFYGLFFLHQKHLHVYRMTRRRRLGVLERSI